MDNKLITTEQFQFGTDEKKVRIFAAQNGAVIPLVDIAYALGHDRSGLTQILNNSKELFEGMRCEVKIQTAGGVQELVCLNRDGVTGLIMKLNYTRLKSDVTKQKVLEFQRWAIKTLSEVMEGSSPVHRDVSIIDVITENLDVADIAIKRSGVPKEVAHGMAWAIAAEISDPLLLPYATYIRAQGKPPEEDSGSVQKLIGEAQSQVADYEMHYSLTKVADYLKKSSGVIRNELERLGVIVQENGTWRLTRYGEKFGKMFMVMPGYPFSTKMRPYIRYNPEVLALLRKSLDGGKQGSLPGGNNS